MMNRQTIQNKLTIITWNANSLNIDKRNELANFMNQYNVDVALISEIHFSQKSRPYIVGYKCIRQDYNLGNSQGVAIYIKHNIPYKVISTLDPQGTNSNLAQQIQSVGIKISPSGTNQLDLFVVYLRPTHKLLFPELDKLLKNEIPTIVGGDLNSKSTTWNCPADNTNGRKLLRHADRRNYIIRYPENPTHTPSIRTNRPSTIDLFLTNNNTITSRPKTIKDLSSDHDPVLLEIKNVNIIKQDKLHYYSYGKAN